MWPAPTAEDWKRPCLIQWQRNWEDAVESAAQALDLARRQGSPAAADIEIRLTGYKQRRPWRQDQKR